MLDKRLLQAEAPSQSPAYAAALKRHPLSIEVDTQLGDMPAGTGARKVDRSNVGLGRLLQNRALFFG